MYYKFNQKKDTMEISVQDFEAMQAKIADLQAYKDSHEKDEEQEIREYLTKRAATQQENAAKIAATKSLLK